MGASHDSRIRASAGSSDCGCVFMAGLSFSFTLDTGRWFWFRCILHSNRFTKLRLSIGRILQMRQADNLGRRHLVARRGAYHAPRHAFPTPSGVLPRPPTRRRLTLFASRPRPIIRKPVVGGEIREACPIRRTLRSGIPYRYHVACCAAHVWRKGIACCTHAAPGTFCLPAQAVRLVKGPFFDRIRAFTVSLNPPAHAADDNGARTSLRNKNGPPAHGSGKGTKTPAVEKVLRV